MRALVILFAALIAMGARASNVEGTVSLLDALVEKCDLIDDEYMGKKTGTEARVAILRTLRGKIGPVSYDLVDGPSMVMNSGSGGNFGSGYEGDRGPKLFPPEGTYKTSTTPVFESSLKVWKAGHKQKDPACTGEIAATLFTEAGAPVGNKLNETKMLALFKASADAGEPSAMFMSAVCYYYGIGCAQNKRKAYKALEAWKYCSGTTKAKRGGWIARRFAFINR